MSSNFTIISIEELKSINGGELTGWQIATIVLAIVLVLVIIACCVGTIWGFTAISQAVTSSYTAIGTATANAPLVEGLAALTS